MKKELLIQFLSVVVALAFFAAGSLATEVTITSSDRLKAGNPVTVKVKTGPGHDLFVVVCTEGIGLK